MDTHKHFMQAAIDSSLKSIENGTGPFGAVIVDKEGKILVEAHNEVTTQNDPTAHAEVNAIRRACKLINNFDLSGCTLYTSCEPCPLCLSACYWAHIEKIYYANTREDAAAIDFDDKEIYEEIKKPIPERKIQMVQYGRENAITVFEKWVNKKDKIQY